jgi:hypothetical protein
MGLVPDYRRTGRILRAWPVSPVQFNRKSITLNGTDEGANCGDIFNYERTDSWSVAGWLKANTPTSWMKILGRSQPSPSYPGWGAYLIGPPLNVGKLRFDLTNTTTTNQLAVSTTTSVATGSWVHFAITYTGNSLVSGVNMYLAGVPVATQTYANSLSASIQTAYDFTIGENNELIDFWNGSLDELSIWDRVLTPAEVSMTYRARDLRLLPFSQHLQGYWSGDGSDGSLMPDYSGNGYNGTPVNMDASNYTTDVHTPT